MRAIRTVLLLTAVGASVATSSTSDDPGWLGGGQVALHNGGTTVLDVEVALTSPSVRVDCALVEALPELLPHVPLDDPGWAGSLEPLEVALVDPSEQLDHTCRVARVEVDGLGSRMLYWRTDTVWGSYPRRAEDPTLIGSPVVSVLPGAPEPFRDGRDALVHPDDPTRIPPCETPGDAFTWSGPTGRLLVQESLPSDRCPTLEVIGEDGALGELEVCVPLELFPFRTSDHLVVVSDGDNLRVTDHERGLELRVSVRGTTPFGIPMAVDAGAGCVADTASGPILVSDVVAGGAAVDGVIRWDLPDRRGWLAVRPPVQPLIHDPAQPRRGLQAALLTER